jgi:hypothetical protein
MKLVWHFVILVCLVYVCASSSLAQQLETRGGGAVLSLTANVTTASILELSSKSKYVEEIETTSPAVRTVRVTLPDAQTADLVKETAAGTLVMARVELLVRFSGYKEETATVLISLAGVYDGSGRDLLKEGDPEGTLNTLAPGAIIKVQGVRSGSRIVRYIGFVVDAKSSPKNALAAGVTYELVH